MWDQQPEKNASFSVKQKHGNKRERMKMKSKVLMYSLRNYNGKGTQRAESIHWKKKKLEYQGRQMSCQFADNLSSISFLSKVCELPRNPRYRKVHSGKHLHFSSEILKIWLHSAASRKAEGRQWAGSWQKLCEASLRLIFSLANLTFTAEFPLLWWCYKHLLGLNCHEWGSTVLQIQWV